MKVAFIQGASKGIGFSLVKQFIQNTNLQVIATARKSSVFNENALKAGLDTSRIQFLEMNITKEDSISKAFDEIKKQRGLECIQYVVNSAAYLLPEKSLSAINEYETDLHFKTNIIGPMLFAKHFHKLLCNPKKTQDRVVWANMSARTGSIGDNHLGGWYSYRITKAALNQLTKNMSIELGRKGIQVLSLHPGTVDTDLSRKYVNNVQHKIFSPDESANALFKILTSTNGNGLFLDFDNKEIPW
jgi:NAD(P)-dependent dehydrogenase (short-subunit alcohol dehydrogenase family)